MSTDQSSRPKPAENPPERTIYQKVGFLGVLKIAVTILIFLVMTLFYTILPIAGLGLLPFLFFGCLCWIVSVCDDLGLY